MNRIGFLLIGFLLILVLLPFAAMADAPDRLQQDKLQKAKQELQQTKQQAAKLAAQEQQARKQLQQFNDRLSVIGKKIRDNQQALVDIDQKMADLSADKQTLLADIDQNRDQSGYLLLAMQRLSRQPVEALVLKPGAPITAARTGMMLSATLPALRNQIDQLQQDLHRLNRITDQLAVQRQKRAERQAQLDVQETDLIKLIRQRKLVLQARRAEKNAAEERAEKLAGHVNDLSQLMAALAAQKSTGRQKPSQPHSLATKIMNKLPLGSKPGMESADGMVLPVAGQITTGFNETDDFGMHTKGITITARKNALVTSPSNGVVRFAGPFRRFDNILIIDHGGGYHSVIGGLYELFTTVGDPVQSDQPLGRMPQKTRPPLYFELRRNGRPTDPKEFLS